MRVRVRLAVAILAAASIVSFSAQGQVAPPELERKGQAPTTSPAPPVVAMAPLRQGARMVYRITGADGQASTAEWTVQAPGTYKGRPVIRLKGAGRVQILDAGTRNWIATVEAGREVEAAAPDRGTWSWPLKVGKRWRSEFVYRDGVNGFTVGPIVTEWTVEAFEPVTTPAGTFPAMRLRGEPGRNNTRRTLLWYAPGPGLVVRREVEQATGRGGERVTETMELVDYGPR